MNNVQKNCTFLKGRLPLSTNICEYVQPVRKESCGEHQLHLGEELLVEAGVDYPGDEKSENNVEEIGFKEDGREQS